MRRSRVSSAGLSSRVCRSSMTSRARRPPQVSRAWAAASTESQPSGIGPSAEVKAEHRWLSSVTVFASQLSARYHATGTFAVAEKPASNVLLPEPAGATTNPTRYCQMRSRRPSTRSRAREFTCGISTLADTTAPDPSLTQVLPSVPVAPAGAGYATGAPALTPTRPAFYVASPLTRYFATLHADSGLSIWFSQLVHSQSNPGYLRLICRKLTWLMCLTLMRILPSSARSLSACFLRISPLVCPVFTSSLPTQYCHWGTVRHISRSSCDASPEGVRRI